MYTFKKKERLNNKKNINELFDKGQSFFNYPFKIYYYLQPNESECMQIAVLFSVGKKQIKNAADRNRVKRLCRESYRLNKNTLYSNLNNYTGNLDIAFVYVGKKDPDFFELQYKMQKILIHLVSLTKKLNNV
jgi:ribonuclease P protein component